MFRILIVEDDNATQAYLKKLINSHKECMIFTAENGLEGLRVLEKESIEGVFMDISMPLMDGIETLEAIRNDPKYKDLPIMMLSAVTARSEIEKALHLKVFDYLLKPLLYHETILRVQRFFEFLEKINGVTHSNTKPVRKNKVLIISGNVESWKNISFKTDPEISLNICDSPLDGIEYFINELPGVVVIDSHLKLMNEKLVAKKIRNIMKENNGFGVKYMTTIIGVGNIEMIGSDTENFDFNLDDRNDLVNVLKDLYKIKLN